MDSASFITTGLYVDVENLQDEAQDVVTAILEEWPSEKAPIPSLVNLYVPADTVELWEVWATTFSNQFQIVVNGIQHYTVTHSKNSADLAIALDALTDLLKGNVKHIAVCSDDSDFISLFAKIRKETSLEALNSSDQPPFLWIVTDRVGTKTPNLERFFPDRFIHVLHRSPVRREVVTTAATAMEVAAEVASKTKEPRGDKERIVHAIVKNLSIGPFKATDCKAIVQKTTPNNKMGKLPDNQFGKQFLDNIWPELEKFGVKLKSTKPNRYEMTQEAKSCLEE